jgi:hypothetical protein
LGSIMAIFAPSLPFDRSYWVIPGRLLAGFYPGDIDPLRAREKQQALLACSIRRVINLMSIDETNGEGEPILSYESELQSLAGQCHTPVVCQRFPVTNLEVPSRQQMRLILDLVDHALAGGEVVYVHSFRGRGRTGTVVGCFLARHSLASGRGVLEKIASLRAQTPDRTLPSPESEIQIRMVCEWREGE